jgi:DNA invertase Pin-like site-specific DNA recombinase
LEQEFNSLDAQRDACEAYIKAQAHQGWVALDTRYDDGGFTGTNTDRPAFRRLIADLAAGRIDVVVVYKVDRLSRSLLDFVQVMDLFNRHGVAFVSVTQNFSTTESIGKLTLNLLISFSSFERDMISDRTRDKIAAARRRGLWTGGTVPLGYDVVDKHLVVNETEAARARQIFELYTQHGSALTVAHLLNQAGHRTKRHEARTGRIKEARPWNKADVLRVLRNPLYAGCMASGGDLYPGEHEGLIDRAVFDCVQADLHDHGGERRPAVRNPA